MVLHIGKHNPRLTYCLNNHSLSTVEVIKDLGVLVDASLSFSAHCESTYKKGLGLVFRLFRSFACTQPAPFIHAYKTYILPVIEYASPVWSPYKVTLVRTLEKVQHVFTRLLLHRCSAHTRLTMPDYSQRLTCSQLHTLQHRRVVNDIIFAVNMLSLKCNLPCSSFWSFKPTLGRVTYFTLSTTRPNSTAMRNSFSHRTCKYLSILFKSGYKLDDITRKTLLNRNDLLTILDIPS